MCLAVHKKKRPSVFIMEFIKSFLEPAHKEINLDVLIDNIHAQQFFEKNKFIEQGDYVQGSKEYKMYTSFLEKA